MPHYLYQKTMKQLSQSLEKKWNAPVKFSTKPLPYNEKWVQTKDETIFPLFIDFQTAGQIKVSSSLSEDQISDTYDLIQWTLISLFQVFKEHETPLYTSSPEIYPLWIQSNDTKLSLKQAYELYEKSPAHSFIHCHASVFDKKLLTSDLTNTLVCILDIHELSKENQLFLAHFIRSSLKEKKRPLIIVSTSEKLLHSKESSKIMPSFIESFISFRFNDNP